MSRAKKTSMANKKRKAIKITLPRLRLPAWRVSLSQLLLLCFFTILLSAAYGSFYVIDAVLEVPVEEVTVHGKFTYLQQDQVSELIAQYVDEGFIQVSLKRLYKELAALPWVYSLVIKRELPNGLSIHIDEQQVAAYWNDDALINQYGEVFTPESVPVIKGLPQLAGKSPQQVLDYYQQVKEQLPQQFRPIKALQIDQRQVLLVKTYTDIDLLMRLEQQEEQLNKWLLIATAMEKEQLKKVKRVDLRYSNGAAIEWNEPLAAVGHDLRGGHP